MNDDIAGEARKPTTWLDTADSVIDSNLARDETIEFTAEDLSIEIPTEFGEKQGTTVRLNGTVRVHSEGLSGPLFAWLMWWDERED